MFSFQLKLVSTVLTLASLTLGHGLHPEHQSGLSINGVPSYDRDHWMRVANEAIYYPPISHPCPQAPFGSAIVNTTSNELICAIANRVGVTGDPTQHGEITAIQHCTQVLRERGLTPQQILQAWKEFSLYTNGEPCPMCMSAIRWAGFKEVVYATSIRKIAESEYSSSASVETLDTDLLSSVGRNQIYIPSSHVLEKSYSLGHQTLMLGNVLTNESDILFGHQFNESAPCRESAVDPSRGK